MNKLNERLKDHGSWLYGEDKRIIETMGGGEFVLKPLPKMEEK
jgi:hypothetical protein